MVDQFGVAPQQQGPTPFDDERGAGGNYMPNVPLPVDNSQMLRELIANHEYGDEAQENFAWVFNRDNVLGFVDEDRKQAMMLSFDILAIDHLNALPYRDFDWNMTKRWGESRHIFETKINRAMGFKHNERMNERIAQISQMQESRQVMRDDTQAGGNRDNFIKRLIGRR